MSCQGCQSFCMQGHQLAIKGPDGNGSNYPNSWKRWKNFIGYSDGTGTPSSIGNSNAPNNDSLTAQSQLDLINYIKAVYDEGTYNPNNGLGYEKLKASGLSLVEDGVSIGSTNLDNAKNNVASNFVIYDYHYNDLLEPLLGSDSPIKSDPKGQSISNNASDSGPVAGWTAQPTALVTSGQTDNSENSLIKASLYRDLYEKASHLMYHPYQCNECNIYEGGQWLEIVEELGVALDKADIRYSWTNSWTATVGGITETNRTDCSGFVNGCVNIFNATLTGELGGLTGNSDQYTNRDSLPPAVQKYFAPYSSSLPRKKGSIVVRHGGQEGSATSHVEVYAQWSGGGSGGEGSHMMHRISGSSCDAGLEYLGGDTTGSSGGGGGGDNTGSSGGQEVQAKFTAYFPYNDAMEGGYYAATGERLNPSSHTCAAPKSIAFGRRITPHGTGTSIDGISYRVNDRGGAINIEGGVYHFDILMSSRSECDNFGVRYGTATIS